MGESVRFLGGSTDRHRALADGSRLAILRALEASPVPLDAHLLADRVGLHINTVRWHLRVLEKTGLITEEARAPTGRGRPRHAYQLASGALDNQPGGFRLLAELLVEVISRRPGLALEQAVDEVGRARGRTLVQAPANNKRAGQREAVAQVVRLLELFGFRPRHQRTRGGERIAMHACPFGQIAAKHSFIVCELHLALLRGALETLGDPLEARSLEPFVRPDLCLVHLGPNPREDAG